jgi:type IV secretion system protein VirB10
VAQLAIRGAGQNINEAGQQITRRNLNIQPTVEVAPGSRLNIFATKDLVLPLHPE